MALLTRPAAQTPAPPRPAAPARRRGRTGRWVRDHLVTFFGIAALVYRERGHAADARAAVALLARRDDIRHSGIGIWAFGAATSRAAAVAGTGDRIAALVAMSPAVLPDAELRDWRARRGADAPTVTAWLPDTA